MVNLIEEWGVWSRHQGYDRPSTPLFALMRANGCFEFGDARAPVITDDDALRVDKAVAKMRKECIGGTVLFDVLFAKYVLGWTYRQIAKRYMTPLEYPHQVSMKDDNPKKKFVHHYVVVRLVDEAERQVNRYL